MSGELERAKAAIRTRLRAAMEKMGTPARAGASAALCARMVRWEGWQRATTILMFSPMPDEPDVKPLLEAAREAGKRVALPRFRPSDGDYEAALVTGAEGELATGRFGIREPGAACPAVPLIHLDLLLIPGVGFAPDGCRLGRGRGFYDRLLASVTGLKCGVAFDEQLVETLPIGPYDIRLDCILTPSCWWSAGRRVVVE